MNINKPTVLSALIAIVVALPAHALEGDTFRPFVSFSRYYDDNLFRQAENEAIFIDGSVKSGPQTDSYNVLAFGANVDWRIKRQQMHARASKNLVRYSNFNSLDYDGSDYLVQWNWQLGNHWNGRVGATETLTQSSFADLNTTRAVNNLRTIDNAFASANWQFHPRWQVGAGVSELQIVNSDRSQRSDDFTEQAGELNLAWRTPKGTSVRTQLRVADAEYPNRQFGTVDNGYSQQELNVSAVWPYSGLLRLQGRLGYSKREYENVSRPDFSGFTGRGSADYSPSGKTVLSLSVYRELRPTNEISSNSLLATGISVNTVWSITSKIALRGDLSDEKVEYQDDPSFLSNAPIREDKTKNASLSLNFDPFRSAVFGLGIRAGRRESKNVINGDYEFNTIFANVRVDF